MAAEADRTRISLLAVVAAVQPVPDVDGGAGSAPNRLTARLVPEAGGIWSAGLDGSTVAVRDMKGLHYVHLLLHRPGVDVSAADLFAQVAGNGRATVAGPGEVDRLPPVAYRRGSAELQRARVAVRKAVVAALRRLAEQDPALSRLLGDTVHTGAVCRYEPDPGRPVRWTLDAHRSS